MNRLLTISILLFFILQACKDDKALLDQAVKEMADHKMFESKFFGLGHDSSLQWARYEILTAKSSETELVQLCNNNSPVVRAYAFQGLIEKKSTRIFEVLIDHIHDVGKFDRIMGCMVDPCYVSDFYLEQVGYFPYDSSWFKITPQQRDYIDSLMLFGSAVLLRYDNYNKIKIRSRDHMLEYLQHNPKYYDRLREIALADVFEALPALSKFKNPKDVPIIRYVYETKGLIGEGYVFDAINNFPHPDLFDIIENAVSIDLQNDNYFTRSIYKYYTALIQYKNPISKKLLAETIAKRGNENQTRRAEYIRQLVNNNEDKFFKGL